MVASLEQKQQFFKNMCAHCVLTLLTMIVTVFHVHSHQKTMSSLLQYSKVVFTHKGPVFDSKQSEALTLFRFFNWSGLRSQRTNSDGPEIVN